MPNFIIKQKGMTTGIMRQKDIRPAPAEIEYKNFKFLITDRPSDQNILLYIQVSEHRIPLVNL